MKTKITVGIALVIAVALATSILFYGLVILQGQTTPAVSTIARKEDVLQPADQLNQSIINAVNDTINAGTITPPDVISPNPPAPVVTPPVTVVNPVVTTPPVNTAPQTTVAVTPPRRRVTRAS